MSYDLMVFDSSAAPRTRAEFMTWYQSQAEWTEDHGYNNPEVTSNSLKAWYKDMIKKFPPLNGPDSNEEDESDYVSDYCIGIQVIYVAFSWTKVEEAFVEMYRLAEKHQVGFFNVSSESLDILFPQNGKLKPLDTDFLWKPERKPWWKFW